ncbi:MAG: lipid A deacylase LpxR family protein [Pseudomonadota bacterium]
MLFAFGCYTLFKSKIFEKSIALENKMTSLHSPLTVIFAFFCICFTSTAGAQSNSTVPPLLDERGTFSFVIENDALVDTDSNYTNGARVSWLSGTKATDGVSNAIANVMGADEDAVRRRGFALGHTIFTPEDTQATMFLPDQHPYAGYAYGEIMGLIEQSNRIDQFALQIGLLGPSAGGEWVQNEVHKLLGVDEAQGWDNQLDDELIVNFSYDRKYRKALIEMKGLLEIDFIPNAGFTESEPFAPSIGLI